MKKVLFCLVCVLLLSFDSQKQAVPLEKMLTYQFTIAEVQTIYKWLGKAPAEEVEALRTKIANEFVKQTDTTKRK